MAGRLKQSHCSGTGIDNTVLVGYITDMKLRGRYIPVTLYVERGDNEVEVSAQGYWFPGSPETGRYGPPEHYSPEVPVAVEDISAKDENGNSFILTEEEKEKVTERIMVKAEEWEPEQL